MGEVETEVIMKKNIIILSAVGNMGGLGLHLINNLKCIMDYYNVTVICPDGDLINILKTLRIKYIIPKRPISQIRHVSCFSSSIFNVIFLRQLFNYILYYNYWLYLFKRLKPDLVCLHSVTLIHYYYILKKINTKVVCQNNETFTKGTFGIRTKIMKMILSKCDGVTFVSEYDYKHSKCKAKLTTIIPMYIEFNDMKHMDMKKARTVLNFKDDDNIVYFLGGISPEKAILLLLKALSLLSDVKNLVLIISGNVLKPKINIFSNINTYLFNNEDYLYYSKVSKMISNNKTKYKIIITGFIDSDLKQMYYKACNVVVFPAKCPHQSSPAIEAGYFSKPIILPDFENTKEFVINYYNGLYFEPNNYSSLAKKIREILTNEKLQDYLGKNNKKFTSKVNNPIIIRNKINNFFNEILRVNEN